MDTRFNSFYTEQMPLYVKGMMELLGEVQLRTYRPWWYTALFREANPRFDQNNRLIHQLAREVLARRRAQSHLKKKDLIDSMLNEQDPKTGKKLTEETIVDNMITFLIGGRPAHHRLLRAALMTDMLAPGHEITSGLLSFLFILLIQHPEAYSKVQSEIDNVLGTGPHG